MYLEKIFVKRYFLHNDHILRLNDGNEERSIVRQPAYEEVTYREIEGEKKFATFVNGIRDNYEIDKKLFGIDAAIALVDDPDKKQSINPKDVAIPESELCIQGSGSITFRLSDYLSGPDRIRDEKRLNLKASRALSECEERHFRKDRRREKARTLLDRYMKVFGLTVRRQEHGGKNVIKEMCQRKENIKKIQSVSNIRSTNEANEIAEDAILIIPILQASMNIRN
ncbi:hypothetical protein GLOIN_2v1764175 [Rhizophagus irregularis DAOM 181602=DAOM 197198]|nr:hypothetical protein GLOIN_2v1764175 [Rhizophagus irregularis DAOM 181602=DAOM 197198]